jgi:RNA recognition motif-containing protein
MRRSRSRSSSSRSSCESNCSKCSERKLVPVSMPDPDSTLANSFLERLHETNAARSDKNDSIVYADNLSKDTTEHEFITALVKSMEALGLLTRPGHPLVGVWKPKNHTFVMMDFRCVEEANNSLLLHGMTFKNHEIKISRPKHYTGSQPTNISSMNCLFGNYALKNTKKRALEEIAASNPKVLKKIEPVSKVLCLKNIVKSSDFQSEAEFNDILDDIRYEAQKYGKIEAIVLPRPGEKGSGNAYIEYETVEQAMAARKILSTKRFNGKFVDAGFHPEVMFLAKDFRETWELNAICQ